jgi:hypothetical protein
MLLAVGLWHYFVRCGKHFCIDFHFIIFISCINLIVVDNSFFYFTVLHVLKNKIN